MLIVLFWNEKCAWFLCAKNCFPGGATFNMLTFIWAVLKVDLECCQTDIMRKSKNRWSKVKVISFGFGVRLGYVKYVLTSRVIVAYSYVYY